MYALENLEVHVSHACNLACESCSHYSNQGHTGNLPLDQAEAWMAPWSKRLAPKVFSLLGGEPTIHRELPAFVTLSRRMFPDSLIRIVTNGFLLKRHDPTLPEAMVRAGGCRLYVTQHHKSEAYRRRFAPAWAIAERWRDAHGLDVRLLPSIDRWRRTYKGVGAAMQPFSDGDPRSSWSHCPARECHQLHDGHLWKCPSLAYLGMQDEKYGLSEAWKPYLQYAPLAPDCSDAELEAWLALEEERFCGMCPAKPETFEMPLPFKTSSRAAAR